MFQDSITLLYGKSRTGKTSRMVDGLRGEDRVCLVDAKCQQLVHLRDFVHLWPSLGDGGKWLDCVVTDFFRAHIAKPFRCVVHCREYQEKNLELLAGLLLVVKNCVVAVDELGLFIPPGPAGALARKTTALIVSGTHDGIRFVGTAQRPSLVHRTARANTPRVLIYRMTDDDDVRLVSKMLPADLAGQVASLPDYVCIEWSDYHPPFVDYSYQGKLAAVIPAR